MIDHGLLSGLPNGVRVLLASPPLTEAKLLELAARWEGLSHAQARMAEALRLFVVTWDPLEWLAPRPEAVATANTWPAELVVYVPVWSLANIARRKHTTMAAALAGLGGSAITAAAAHEDAVMSGRYGDLVVHGKLPDLLSGESGPALERSPSWPCRRSGRISASARSQAHQKEADALIKRRMARAEASNPAGWRMMADASARLSLPHLPGGLATRLTAAGNDPVLRARLLAEAAAGFPGRPDEFGSALAENRNEAGKFPARPVALIRDLGRAAEAPRP